MLFADSQSSELSPVCDTPVLVTGGTGFVAGHLIQQLLQRGYHVRATLRDETFASSEQFEYLSRLQMANELLEVVPLDLLTDVNDFTWTAAFADVEYVMHVASPVVLQDDNPEENIMKPIIIGTQNVLKFCQETKSVKKLILTSCMNAMTDIFEPGVKYDESHWNETATPDNCCYSYSKTTAEREAHRMALSTNASFQLVSILPGTVLGAHLGKKMTHSHHFFRTVSMINASKRAILNMSLAISDVRDVARFHIAAMERESNEPTERFLCANVAMPMERIFQIIHENFDDLIVPTRKIADMVVRLRLRTQPEELQKNVLNKLGRPPFFSRSKLKTLGVPLRTPAESIVDTCRFFIENNFIKFVDDADAGACIIL